MHIATMNIAIVSQLILPGPAPYTPNHLITAPNAATRATINQTFLLFFNLLILSKSLMIETRFSVYI